MNTCSEMYEEMVKQLQGLTEGTDWWVTALSNASALIYQSMESLNWAGFYMMRDGALKLGPFQGKVACTHIAVGHGVCGTAVKEDRVQRVADVHQFPGHIACDGASNSEIVLPLHKNGQVVGVLDIDSPIFDRFSKEDEEGLLQIVKVLEDEVL